MIHVAIVRKVRPGREQEFERRLAEMFREVEHEPGVEGAYLLRPVDPGSREYGIVRTFTDEATRERFYASDRFRRWNETLAPLVEGAPRMRDVHGLEGFFVPPAAGRPPAWKMALVTWLAVNPAVYVGSQVVPEVFGPLPPLVRLLVTNAFVVACLTWVLMPLLTRVFARWLRVPPPAASEGMVTR